MSGASSTLQLRAKQEAFDSEIRSSSRINLYFLHQQTSLSYLEYSIAHKCFPIQIPDLLTTNQLDWVLQLHINFKTLCGSPASRNLFSPTGVVQIPWNSEMVVRWSANVWQTSKELPFLSSNKPPRFSHISTDIATMFCFSYPSPFSLDSCGRNCWVADPSLALSWAPRQLKWQTTKPIWHLCSEFQTQVAAKSSMFSASWIWTCRRGDSLWLRFRWSDGKTILL